MNEAMTPDEFKSVGERLWGQKWRKSMARILHKDRITIYRYCVGDIQISILVSMVLRSWVDKFEKTGEIPG